jgi:hypothetical protein
MNVGCIGVMHAQSGIFYYATNTLCQELLNLGRRMSMPYMLPRTIHKSGCGIHHCHLAKCDPEAHTYRKWNTKKQQLSELANLSQGHSQGHSRSKRCRVERSNLPICGPGGVRLQLLLCCLQKGLLARDWQARPGCTSSRKIYLTYSHVNCIHVCILNLTTSV